MKKCTFIDYKLIKKHSNISIKISNPINEKKIKNIGNEQKYFTIINKDNLYYLFYKNKPDKTNSIWETISYYSGDYTYVETCINPISFNNINDIKLICNEPIISHNIIPFFDKNNDIKLIGGLHLTEKYYNQRILKKENDILIKYNNSNIVDPNKKLNGIKCNGIYLLDFNYGNVKSKYDLPIVNGTNNGLVDKRTEWCISEFDGRSTIVYFKKKYYIYVRCNFKEAKGSIGSSNKNKKTNVKGGGIRAVQYAVSDDLINWSEFKFININFNFSKDNIYFFGVQKYNDDILVSTFPYSNGTEAYIGISFSHNGIDWTNITKLINSKVSKSNTDRAIDFNIHHILEYKNKLLFYMHRNYIWWENKKEEPYISYLELPKDRLTYLYSKDGYFTIELENINDLALNYKIEKDGYIMVQIENNTKYIFDKFDKLLNRDSIYTILKWNNNSFSTVNKVLINFKLKNSNIYCLYY